MGIVAVVFIGVYLATVAVAWVQWLQMGFPIASLPLRPSDDGGVVQLPTWVGDVIALSTPVVVVSLWMARTRAAGLALAVTATAAVGLSGTRSVLLLVIVLAVVAAAFFVRERASRGVSVGASLLAAGVLVLGVAVIVFAGRSFDEGRSSAYVSAVDRFVSSPIMGTGPGTYGVLRMSDQVDTLSHLAFPDAHNIVLTAAAESGIGGIIGLGASLVFYALEIRRSWRRASAGRPVVAAAVFGLAIVAGHAMGEVVFALIGIVLLVLAALAIASTDAGAPERDSDRRDRRLDAVLLAGCLVIVIGSIGVVHNEQTLDAVTEADRVMRDSPEAALIVARQATDRSPDNVPSWWVRMEAADRVGDRVDAILSARRVITLEGFGQEWQSLGALLDRDGDTAGAASAYAMATAHLPEDPVVDLNDAIHLITADHVDDAVIAMRRLLTNRPDIEPALRDGPSGLAGIAAAARPLAAADLMEQGSFDAAMLIALSGEDDGLARSVAAGIAVEDPSNRAYWEGLVDAWFGDRAARTTIDSAAMAHPSITTILWSWRLAARSCDTAAMDRWERASRIGLGAQPMEPTAMGEAPAFQVRLLPSRYPGVVWRMDRPEWPYVGGIWTFALGRPACAP